MDVSKLSDDELQAQLTAVLQEHPDMQSQDFMESLPGQVARKLASVGTGAVRGGVALGTAPFDAVNLSATLQGRRAPFAGSDDVQSLLKEHLYQPQGRIERNLAAVGSAVPMAATRNPALTKQAMASSLLGEDATNWNMLSGISPDIIRAVGNLAIPTVGGAVGMVPSIAGHALDVVHPGAANALQKLTKILGKMAPTESTIEGPPGLKKLLLQALEKAGTFGAAPLVQYQANKTLGE